MKIVRFRLKPETETFYGVLDGLSIKRLSAEPYDGLHFTGDEYAADSVIFDAPCEPSKIVAVDSHRTLFNKQPKDDTTQSSSIQSPSVRNA